MLSSNVPLYDMSYKIPFGQPIAAVLAVSGHAGDQRHSLGVPPDVPIDRAITLARLRGWRVHGVWRRIFNEGN